MTSKVSRGIHALTVLGAIYRAILVASWAGVRVIRWADRVQRPWAYAKPPLARDWQGEARVGGTRLRLVLSLWVNLARTKYDGSDLHGRAVLYYSTGRVQSYPLWGGVHDRQGQRTELHLLPLEDIPGLRLAALTEMNWDGDTTLRGQAILIRGGADGSTSMTTADRPIPFVLQPTAVSGTCTVR
ncbi:hypothetical protein SBA4_750003 [Candidatus Sulfopaludibacter sp. SbA4]|nr:hypothetical protein SBA4_750003 [Candidatus Sulfopaludibacter sp. SbA4]